VKPDINAPGSYETRASSDLARMLCDISHPPEDRVSHAISVVCKGHREAEAFGKAGEQASRALAQTVPWVMMPEGYIGPVSPCRTGEVLVIMASPIRAEGLALELMSESMLTGILDDLRDAVPDLATDRQRLAQIICLGLVREQDPDEAIWSRLAYLSMARALITDNGQRGYLKQIIKLGVTPGIIMLAVPGTTHLMTLPIARCADIFRPAEGSA